MTVVGAHDTVAATRKGVRQEDSGARRPRAGLARSGSGNGNVDQIARSPTGARRRQSSHRRDPVIRRVLSSDRPWVWLLPVVALLLFIGIYPFVYNIWNTFREFNPMTGQVEPVGLENWQRLIRESSSRVAGPRLSA